MLFKSRVLEEIAAGRVTLAFRRWKRPTVRAGGRLRTARGELAIGRVDAVRAEDVTEKDARRAGYASRRDLLDDLAGRSGTLFRIEVSFAGADRRVALRARARLTAAERDELVARLGRMDASAEGEAWTRRVLHAIERDRGTRAADLAHALGMPTDLLKRRVRRLKEHGLTESLAIGYALSPRGRAFLSGDG